MPDLELTSVPPSAVGRLGAWLLASRPKTLWAALVPVLIGTVIAFDDGRAHWPAAALALFAAVAIQVGTNLANDYSDFSRGADTHERKGPVRVTQAGLLTPRAVWMGAATAFILAAVAGLYLIVRGGWPVLAMGVLSIASGIVYTGGPKPLGYLGLGDVFVLVFFGPVAVAGTYYVQALAVTPTVIIAGLAPGLLSVALLSVNNLRDVNEDRAAGKRTLVVRFGVRFGRWEYISCVILACAIPAGLYVATGLRFWTLACLVVIGFAMPIFRSLLRGTSGRDLVPLLGSTARLSILYCVIFCLTWVM